MEARGEVCCQGLDWGSDVEICKNTQVLSITRNSLIIYFYSFFSIFFFFTQMSKFYI